jgi:hypothetical protein
MTVLPNSDPAIIMRRFSASAYRRRPKRHSAAVSGFLEFARRRSEKLQYKQSIDRGAWRSGSGMKSPKRAFGSEPAEEFRGAPARAINSVGAVSPFAGPDPSSVGSLS